MLNRITKRHIIGGCTALVIMLVTFAVIWGAWRSSVMQKPVPLENAAEAYSEALSVLNSQDSVYYQVEGTISTTVGSNTLEERFTQLITREATGSNHQRICVEEIYKIGSYDIKRFSFYADETEYTTVQGSSFQASVSVDDFMAKFTPSALAYPAFYTEINGIRIGKESTINFTKPTSIESWVASGVELIHAEATARLNKDGDLTSSVYTASYKQGDTSFAVHYTVKIINEEFFPIQLPDASLYTPVSAIDAPFQLEKACGYLMSINSIQSQYTDTIICEAFGDERSQSILVNFSGTESWKAQVDTNISVSNSSKAGTVTTSAKYERFADNTYSVSSDGSNYNSNPDVDLTAMTSYCQNLLIGTIALPQYITAADSHEIEDIYSISFRTSEEFAQILAEEACTTLYQNPSVLSNISQDSATESVTCYLNINKHTGVPISSGFEYKGIYTISNLPYQLSFTADQTYTLPTEITTGENTGATEYTEAQETFIS